MARDADGKITIPWRNVSIVTVIGLIPAVIAMHQWYVQWHTEFGDGRWAKKAEVMLIAQAEPLKQQIALTQVTANETADKVDLLSEQVTGLQISSAITVVASLKDERDRHLRNPENTDSWRRERDRLIRLVEQAEQYRDCLRRKETNCEELRGW